METIAKGAEWLIGAAQKVETSSTQVEDLTSMLAKFFPQAGMALSVEKLGYASLGSFIAVLKTADAALEQNLLNSGVDASFIAQIKALIAAFPAEIAAAEAAFKTQAPATTAAAQKASLASVQTLNVANPSSHVTPAVPVTAAK